MNSHPFRITPTANMQRPIKSVGSVVVVKGGAWATYRIHFKPPSGESYRGESSYALENGQAYMAPDGQFTEFWITTEYVRTDDLEDLELIVLDCATPVILLNDGRGAGFTFHPIIEGVGVNVDAETTLTFWQDTNWQSTSSVDDNSRALRHPRGFIGGGVRADNPFTLHAYAAMDPQISKLVWLATWAVTQVDPKGKYSCSFEHGARVGHTSGAANTISSSGLLAWPMYGLILEAVAPAGPGLSLDYTLYDRRPV